MSAVGITPSWQTAVFTHLVWIVPIVTLIVSIRLYGLDVAQEEAAFDSGATRFQAFLAVTLPQMMPGIFSGALFAFLLSWANLPLSAYTSGADTTLPDWLYSRMATNYAPMVPAVSVLSILAQHRLRAGLAGGPAHRPASERDADVTALSRGAPPRTAIGCSQNRAT